MPEIAIELTYEKIIEAASKLSEDEKERLFFFLNKDYAKALDEMRKDAWKSHQQGEKVILADFKGVLPASIFLSFLVFLCALTNF